MKTSLQTATLCAALLGGAAAFVPGARAGELPNHHTVGGMDVYLGVMSSSAIRAMPGHRVEKVMHGGGMGPGSYHVNVSVLDARTRAPIGDARVQARVEQIGLGTVTRRLEPMAINGMVSYGNYFRMNPAEPYWIDLVIARPGRPDARTRFRYRVY